MKLQCVGTALCVGFLKREKEKWSNRSNVQAVCVFVRLCVWVLFACEGKREVEPQMDDGWEMYRKAWVRQEHINMPLVGDQGSGLLTQPSVPLTLN